MSYLLEWTVPLCHDVFSILPRMRTASSTSGSTSPWLVSPVVLLTIIASFGYTNAQAQLFTVPPYAVAFVLTLLISYFSRSVAVSRNLRHRLHATLRYRIRDLSRSDSEQPGQVFRYIPCGDRGFCLHPSHALLGGQYGRESLGCRCQTRNDELVRTVLL